jgi:hypothetical protein
MKNLNFYISKTGIRRPNEVSILHVPSSLFSGVSVSGSLNLKLNRYVMDRAFPEIGNDFVFKIYKSCLPTGGKTAIYTHKDESILGGAIHATLSDYDNIFWLSGCKNNITIKKIIFSFGSNDLSLLRNAKLRHTYKDENGQLTNRDYKILDIEQFRKSINRRTIVFSQELNVSLATDIISVIFPNGITTSYNYRLTYYDSKKGKSFKKK